MEEALLEGMEEERATPPDIYLVMISILLSSSFTFWLVDFITVGFFKKDCCSVIMSDLWGCWGYCWDFSYSFAC